MSSHDLLKLVSGTSHACRHAMIDQDDVRFSSFTRDLARRHRRPRSFPHSPVRNDALEQLCGGGQVSPDSVSMIRLPDTSEFELPDLGDDEPSQPS
jgi:hypothetical protein